MARREVEAALQDWHLAVASRTADFELTCTVAREGAVDVEFDHRVELL